MGGETNGASRWMTIPVINQTFQPSDLAKLALISHLASMLSRRQQHLDDFKTIMLPVMLWVGTICSLIILSNASTALLLFATCMLLMFIGRVPLKAHGRDGGHLCGAGRGRPGGGPAPGHGGVARHQLH